ncbi:dihydrolipoyl dehydrogenase [Eubacteriales bacterium OttesenSCG-928-K08]|nr:dihydrolipoyl dehydrogenase [Eubacteriales bacterium OttesenSCG-928-K08]
MKTDLIVIGGGPGGYLAAERAAQGGMSVKLFEEASLGGVCLNEGCIPSKALLHSAKVYDYALFGEAYGVKSQGVTFDMGAVVKRKDKVVRTLVAGVRSALKSNGVEVILKRASIVGKTQDGFAVEADGERYVADRLLIASGSKPAIPPITGLREGMDRGFVLTNREVLNLSEPPANFVVIGGGVIGLEMASYYRSAGSAVTVIEMLENIAGQTESEIASLLLKEYQKKGVVFKLGAKVVEVVDGGLIIEIAGERERIEADVVLLSAGRKPVIDGLGLETLDVKTERGAIVTDTHMRTNIKNVYAVGDCNGKSMLAHTAYREAEVAVNHMLNNPDCMRYSAVPAVIYTNPEVACVGETEESALEKGIQVKVVKLSMRYSGRYVAENADGNGIFKLIVHEKENRVLGVHMIGSYASEIIPTASLMIESRAPVKDLQKLVFPHPTVSEILREALFAVN